MNVSTCFNLRDHPIFLVNNSYFTACELVPKYCPIENGFINYIEWIVCSSMGRTFTIILMFIWLFLLLLGVAITADSFFGPCLIVVTRLLRMSQNLAGVTLLAFGNGAADIFSAIASANSNDDGNAGLVFGGILGAGLFVNCVTAGVIMIIRPFQCARRPVMKDLLFYTILCAWVLVIFLREKIYLAETIGFVALYGVYVFVTVGGRAYFTNVMKKQVATEIDPQANPDSTVVGGERRSVEMADLTGQVNPAYLNESFDERELSNRPLSNPFFTKPAFHLTVQNNASATASGDASPATLSTGGGASNAPKTQTSQLTVSSAHVSRSNTVKRNNTGRGGSKPLFRHNTYLARWVMQNKADDELSWTSRRSSGENKDEPVLRPRTRSQIPTRNTSRHSSLKRHRASTSAVTGDSVKPTSDIIRPVAVKSNFLAPPVPNFMFTVEDADSAGATAPGGPAKVLEAGGPTPAKMENAVSLNADPTANDATDNEEEAAPYVYPGLWQEFLHQMIPIDLDEWGQMSVMNKIIDVIRAPLLLIIRLTTPVVDEEKPMFGWSKIMNILHCITTPLFCLFAINHALDNIGGGFPLFALFLILSVGLAVAVWFTSQPDTPPKYHSVYSFVGFGASIIWIYSFANEIVNILNTIGFQFKISEAILGLSLLAWANSVADMMSNIVLARNNYPRIAFAACIGGPLFNALLGLGIPFMIKCVKNEGSYTIQSSTVQFLLVGFLLGMLLINLICIPLLLKFNLRPPLGIVLIIIYTVFFVVALMGEFGVFG